MAIRGDRLTLERLEELLDEFGVDPTQWKSGKTPADLLRDLRSGERQLVLVQVVDVVKMRMLSPARPGMELVELGKKHAGSEPVMQKKPRAPSGKKSGQESAYAALERELWEELHLVPTEVILVEGDVKTDPPEDSRSLTGILGTYKLYWNELTLTDEAEQKLQAFWSDERQRYEIPDQSEEGKMRGTMLYFAWAPLSDGH